VRRFSAITFVPVVVAPMFSCFIECLTQEESCHSLLNGLAEERCAMGSQ
jgi:hypothetical protein